MFNRTLEVIFSSGGSIVIINNFSEDPELAKPMDDLIIFGYGVKHK